MVQHTPTSVKHTAPRGQPQGRTASLQCADTNLKWSVASEPPAAPPPGPAPAAAVSPAAPPTGSTTWCSTMSSRAATACWCRSHNIGTWHSERAVEFVAAVAVVAAEPLREATPSRGAPGGAVLTSVPAPHPACGTCPEAPGGRRAAVDGWRLGDAAVVKMSLRSWPTTSSRFRPGAGK